MSKKEAVKKWWEKNGTYITTAVGLTALALVSIRFGMKLSELKTENGILFCEGSGYLKFFNPETGQQLTPSEFCQLEIK